MNYFNKCLEIQQNIKGIQSIYSAVSYSNIASVYMAQMNFTTAMEYYQKSLMLRSYFIKEN